MNTPGQNDWRTEFGINDLGPGVFFANRDELNAPGIDRSQVHVLRRAFDQLGIDGVFCIASVPLVYFKVVAQITTPDIALLHRKIWNHGGAPILVVIAHDTVHVYSALVPPAAEPNEAGRISALVEILDRVSSLLRQFLSAVESGEFFRRHAKSFDPAHRVDRDLLNNLQATREKLFSTRAARIQPAILDALLCRLVFTCYLFDRAVVGPKYLESIGLKEAGHLRDVLALEPKSRAKTFLYKLFRKLGEDFNGDLFSDNLSKEAKLISDSCIEILDDFFRATSVQSGQRAFWPYDFGIIPVETISAIYERFLKQSDRQEGAVYTPRFLAEVVLDMALANTPSLLSLRCFDPACGSGIFLVGLFNRMAEEWKQANLNASNDRKARELMRLLRENLFGADINPTACRITAFSLYLAYLDQLAPRDVQELQKKGRALPKLVYRQKTSQDSNTRNILCGDFFTLPPGAPIEANLIVGNPPWGSTAIEGSTAAMWCSDPEHYCPVPDRQLATAFVWKATQHVENDGRICFVLPHGVLFNHSKTALEFQRTLLKRHAIERVLNLTDFQFFLFEEARHPALVIAYRKQPPKDDRHVIEYWSPKADWLMMRIEALVIAPEDRSSITVRDVLNDLNEKDAPQIWKRRYWATPRDQRLIDRLSLYPRLRDSVRQAKDRQNGKRWLIAEGFQPLGKNDDRKDGQRLELPSTLFIEATSPNLDLFILPDDCEALRTPSVTVRGKSNKNISVFRAPHVLIAKGFTSVAYSAFDVSFRHALRGITGPKEDQNLLIFLAAYMRSPLARYFLFQTSSNWGVSRQEVHVEELLRLPFPLPETLPNPERARNIVKEIGEIVTAAIDGSIKNPQDRSGLVREANERIDPLIGEYFDLIPVEQILVSDTSSVIIPSVRPSRTRANVPTIQPSTEKQMAAYTTRLTDTLNSWAKTSNFRVEAQSARSEMTGIGLAVLHKVKRSDPRATYSQPLADILAALDSVRTATSRNLNTVQLARGTKVFDNDRLYVVKPLGQRFWTETAALNDADEIAASILMHTPQGVS